MCGRSVEKKNTVSPNITEWGRVSKACGGIKEADFSSFIGGLSDPFVGGPDV